jgi:hypothetical protein
VQARRRNARTARKRSGLLLDATASHAGEFPRECAVVSIWSDRLSQVILLSDAIEELHQ